MRLFFHRMFWDNHSHKNFRLALISALDLGFGIETDICDFDGRLVISHDPPLVDISFISLLKG